MILGILIGLVILMALVALHELGHAIVARRNGVVVEEFAIGFPPKALSKRPKKSFLGKNVEYRLNWLPLGGYVRMKGEYDSSNKKGDYGAAGYWAKTKILFAGVFVNWVVAAILLTILAWTGLPKIIDNQFTIQSDTKTTVAAPGEVIIASTAEGSPAAEAGILKGDKVVTIEGRGINAASDVSEAIKDKANQAVQVVVVRDNEKLDKQVVLSGESKLGITMGERRARELRQSTWSAPIVGVGTTVQLTQMTFVGVGEMLYKLGTGLVDKLSQSQSTRDLGNQKLDEVGQSVTGPVGILGVIFPQAGQAGFTMVMFLTALISLSLAVMNVLPIPALDGGRWLVMTIYKLRNKVLTKEREENIQAVGMLILLCLMLIITIVDIGKL